MMGTRAFTVQQACARYGATWLPVPERAEAFEYYVDTSVSMWARFYRWIADEVPGVDFNSLHNTCVVGRDTMRWLRQLEGKRIRLHYGYSGEKLKRAIAWTDGDQGPQELLENRPISGRIVVILPDAWGFKTP